MTRDEQIYNEANEYAKHAQDELKDFMSTAFANGAIWADANPHPNWHKYPDEKPPKDTDEVSKVVLVWLTSMQYPIKARMFYEQRKGEIEILNVEYWYSLELGCHIHKDCIMAWMELPQPPKFD